MAQPKKRKTGKHLTGYGKTATPTPGYRTGGGQQNIGSPFGLAMATAAQNPYPWQPQLLTPSQQALPNQAPAQPQSAAPQYATNPFVFRQGLGGVEPSALRQPYGIKMIGSHHVTPEFMQEFRQPGSVQQSPGLAPPQTVQPQQPPTLAQTFPPAPPPSVQPQAVGGMAVGAGKAVGGMAVDAAKSVGQLGQGLANQVAPVAQQFGQGVNALANQAANMFGTPVAGTRAPVASETQFGPTQAATSPFLAPPAAGPGGMMGAMLSPYLANALPQAPAVGPQPSAASPLVQPFGDARPSQALGIQPNVAAMARAGAAPGASPLAPVPTTQPQMAPALQPTSGAGLPIANLNAPQQVTPDQLRKEHPAAAAGKGYFGEGGTWAPEMQQAANRRHLSQVGTPFAERHQNRLDRANPFRAQKRMMEGAMEGGSPFAQLAAFGVEPQDWGPILSARVDQQRLDLEKQQANDPLMRQWQMDQAELDRISALEENGVPVSYTDQQIRQAIRKHRYGSGGNRQPAGAASTRDSVRDDTRAKLEDAGVNTNGMTDTGLAAAAADRGWKAKADILTGDASPTLGETFGRAGPATGAAAGGTYGMLGGGLLGSAVAGPLGALIGSYAQDVRGLENIPETAALPVEQLEHLRQIVESRGPNWQEAERILRENERIRSQRQGIWGRLGNAITDTLGLR